MISVQQDYVPFAVQEMCSQSEEAVGQRGGSSCVILFQGSQYVCSPNLLMFCWFELISNGFQFTSFWD